MVPTATLSNARQQRVKVGGNALALKRRSSYLVQWFSMTKEVQINGLVVYGCKRFQLAHIELSSPRSYDLTHRGISVGISNIPKILIKGLTRFMRVDFFNAV